MSELSEISSPFESIDVSGNNNPDIPNAKITTVKFDGTNYLAWSQSTLLYISGKDKENYILVEIVIPSVTDSKYRKWKTDNATVMSWFLHSMKSELEIPQDCQTDLGFYGPDLFRSCKYNQGL